MADPDPHARIHELAQVPHEDHPPALGDAAGDESPEELIAKLDKRLTGRINDLRKDFDTTKKAISDSVKKISDDVGSLKTSVENNKASIEAQDASIKLAEKKATDAKTAADAATAKADQVAADLHTLDTAYRSHTHGLHIALDGDTKPPNSGGPTQ